MGALYLTQAWRAWKSAKGVAIFTILALTLGIGSAVSIYTIVNAVLLKPLPFQHGDRWVVVYATRKGASANSMSGASGQAFLDFRQRAHSFEAFGWFAVLGDFNLTAPGRPQHLNGLWTTASLVNSLGVPMLKGRWFGDVRHEPTGVHSVVISEALWRRLGSTPDIVGKTIALDGILYTVTGVTPSWFRLAAFTFGTAIQSEDVWVPLDEWAHQNETQGAYVGYGRLRPGVDLSTATAEARQIAAAMVRSHSGMDPDYSIGIRSLKQTASQAIRQPLLLLLGATALLLLITCANVSGLLVARSVQRARETAVRVALGAGWKEFGLQYFSEGFFVAAAGALLGTLASYAALRLILKFAGSHIPRAEEIYINSGVLLYAVGLAFFTALLSSLAPLWQAARTQPNEALSEGIRASSGVRSRRLSRSLIITEIALAFTLLTAAGLLRSDTEALLHTWPGFEARNVAVFDLQPSSTNYGDLKKLIPYEQRLLTRLRSIAGVESVAIGSQLPMGGCCFTASLSSKDPNWKGRFPQDVNIDLVSADYFTTLRIPLLAGRALNEHDDKDNPTNIVINEAAARQFWPSGKAVGGIGLLNNGPVQVVGVAVDVKIDTLAKAVTPEIYLLNAQGNIGLIHFFLRTHLSEVALSHQVRDAVQAVDSAQPIFGLSTMPAMVHASMALQLDTSGLTGFFATASLLMAMLGIYGVTSYFVRQRTVEMGTRMALGAVPRDLLRLVLDSGWKICGAGLVGGGLATALVTWVLHARFDLHQVHWPVFVYSILVVAAVSTGASLVPAWRATLLTPMMAIRDNPEGLVDLTQRGVHNVFRRLVDDADSSTGLPPVVESTLLTEFIDAARHAESFDAAIHAALVTLKQQMNCRSVLLFERKDTGDYACVSAVPNERTLVISANGFLLNRLRFYPLPLPIDESDVKVWQTWAASFRPAYVGELNELASAAVRMAVPLRTHREILGLLLLGQKLDKRPYTSADKRLLRMCAEQLTLMLENGRLTQRVVEQEKLRRDVALASEVQKRLLPDRSPETSIGSLSAYTLPARSVGGDYYDFLQVGDRRIGLALADVAGKGVAAALIMSVVQASLRVLLAEENLTLPDLAAKMNRFLHRSTGSNSYATFFYAQVNETTLEMRYVNAGHNPPFLFRGDDTAIEGLAQGGMIIGLFPFAAYEEGTVQLRSGDVLIIFSDGVTEALNMEEEEFGEGRLQGLLKQYAKLSAAEMSTAIARDLHTWIGDADQHDDLTFVVFKVD